MEDIAAAAFGPPPKIVKPRRAKYRHMKVVAIRRAQVLTEDGETMFLHRLIQNLPKMQPTIFVKMNPADFVAALDDRYGKLNPGTWQWHASHKERGIGRPEDGKHVAHRVDTTIYYFGWKGAGNGKGARFHKIIDCTTLYASGNNIDQIWPGEEDELIRMLRWGVALRDFCDENNMEVKPTAGAMGRQFLTDPRFYPNARRKVPVLTNDSVRQRMPGNFYYLSIRPTTDKEYTVYYIDQRRAHHYHARTISFPHSDGLYAMGCFTTLEPSGLSVTDAFCGLYCLDLDVPVNKPTSGYIRAWLRHSLKDTTVEKRFIYSNELQFLLDMGYTVRQVRAAWGSHRRDEGLELYARWAESQLDKYGDPAWLKPLLLSTYGSLAMRPREFAGIFKQARKGDPVSIPTGECILTGLAVIGKKKIDPKFANVLHRGMIEAATRCESIAYAHHLHSTGYRVLHIYADAVIVLVDEDKPSPLMIEPWRLHKTLHHWQPINSQAFQSGEMTRLPGVVGISRDSAKFRQRAPGRAPRIKKTYEALTGRVIYTDTRTGKEIRHGDV